MKRIKLVTIISAITLTALVTAFSYVGCGGGGGSSSGSSASTTDTVAPTVASTGPVASATNVAFKTVITATFSEAMQVASISSTTFTLSNALGSVSGTVTCAGAAITFTPSIALMGGTVYTATVTTGAKDSAGNALAADYAWSFTTPYSRFAYVANYSDNTISCYTLDNSTGQLRHNGYVTAGTQPWSVAVDPSGQFVYAANFGSNNISCYVIDPVNGTLSETAGSPVASGANPRAVAVDPAGRFVYTANSGGTPNISVYSRNSGTGDLAPSSSVAGTDMLSSFVIGPSGEFAYVTVQDTNKVSTYAINQSNGSLSIVGSPGNTASTPYSVAVDPSGQFAYLGTGGGNSVFTYSVNQITGALSATGTAPHPVDVPYVIAIDPSGRFAYASSEGGQSVSAYSIDPITGSLTTVGNPVTNSGYPSWVTADPSGKFLYVTNKTSNTVCTYSIDQVTGELALSWTVTTRSGPWAIAIASGANPVAYKPKCAYEVSISDPDTVRIYDIDAVTGGLTAQAGDYQAGINATGIATDPLGRFAYVAARGENVVSIYNIDSVTGGFTTALPVTIIAGTQPRAVAVDPSGRFVYVTNEGDDTVSAYLITQTTGGLTEIGSAIASGDMPYAIAIDPSGRFAYVPNYGTGANTISAYAINKSTGALSEIAGSPFAAGTKPNAVTVDPTGRFVYATNWTSRDVSMYAINPASGALVSLGTTVAASSAMRAVTADPTGRFVYAGRSGAPNSAIRKYFIDQSTGGLTYDSEIQSGDNTTWITVDPAGRFAYVANWGSNNIYIYTIDPTTGTMNAATPANVWAIVSPNCLVITGTIE